MKKLLSLVVLVVCSLLVGCSKPKFEGKVIFDIFNADCSTGDCASFTIRVETDLGKTSEIRTEEVTHLEVEYDASLYVWTQAVSIVNEAGNSVSIQIFKNGELIAGKSVTTTADQYGGTLPARLFSVIAKHIVE